MSVTVNRHSQSSKKLDITPCDTRVFFIIKTCLLNGGAWFPGKMVRCMQEHTSDPNPEQALKHTLVKSQWANKGLHTD